jgi:excisionase family DNA binding protein
MTDTTAAEAPSRSDLLYGAAAIADFLGLTNKAVYHLLAAGRLPHFKVGRTVCARRSSVLAAFERMEENQQAGNDVVA